MFSIFDTAAYLIQSHPKVLLKPTGLVETTKIQKLSYYCQGWHYAWSNKPLFSEDFQAWKFGPVEPSLYDFFKNSRGKPNSLLTQTYPLNEDEIESIDTVIQVYGKLSRAEIVELVHNESPWLHFRKGKNPFEESDVVIEKETIFNYFKELNKSNE